MSCFDPSEPFSTIMSPSQRNQCAQLGSFLDLSFEHQFLALLSLQICQRAISL